MSDQNSFEHSESGERDAATAARQDMLVAIARREREKHGWKETPPPLEHDLPMIPLQEIREILQDILSHEGKHYVKPHPDGYLGDAMVKYTCPSNDTESYLFLRKVMVAQCILMIMLQEMGQSCIEGGCSEEPDANGLLELRGHWVNDVDNAIPRLMDESRSLLNASYEKQIAFANLLTEKVAQEIVWDNWNYYEQEIPRAIIADVELERPPETFGRVPSDLKPG